MYVYHRTLENNLHKIMSNGLKASYRNTGKGYAKSNLIYECDKSLDLLNEKLSLNKPKRLKSNFAWLNIKYAKYMNLGSKEKEIVLRLEVNPSSVFISHQWLWDAAFQSFKFPKFNFPESTFEELAFLYWINVVDLDTFLQNKLEICFPDSFDDQLKKYFVGIWENSDLYEIIIPDDIEPGKISLT